jgi:hypothetical protein
VRVPRWIDTHALGDLAVEPRQERRGRSEDLRLLHDGDRRLGRQARHLPLRVPALPQIRREPDAVGQAAVDDARERRATRVDERIGRLGHRQRVRIRVSGAQRPHALEREQPQELEPGLGRDACVRPPRALALGRDLERERRALVVDRPCGGARVDATGEEAGETRRLPRELDADRRPCVLAVQLRRLPLAREQPQRVSYGGGEPDRDIGGERHGLEACPRRERGDLAFDLDAAGNERHQLTPSPARSRSPGRRCTSA